MPRQWQRNVERHRMNTTHPRQEYINSEWDNEAGNANVGPDNYERIYKRLKARWNTLRPVKKRRYVYELEKRLPLHPDRYNTAFTEAGYLMPTPEEVIDYQINGFTGKGKHPNSNAWIKRRRAAYLKLTPAEQQSRQQRLRKIMEARGHQLAPPHAVPSIPANNEQDYGILNAPAPSAIQRAYHIAHFDQPADGQQWQYHRAIYMAGDAHGHVHLYRLVDGNNNTVKVRVVKVEVGARMTDEEGRVHSRLYQRCPDFVPRIYNYRLAQWSDLGADPPHDGQRPCLSMYLEYVPHHTLDGVILHYSNTGQLIPEPFIWYCFRAMTKVCLASQAVNPQIINLDLKPTNVALSHRVDDPLEWARSYPQPKILDFGSAFRMKPTRANPDFYTRFGTPGWDPPELLRRDPAVLNQLHTAFGMFPNVTGTLARLNTLLPVQKPDGTPDPVSFAGSWSTVWQIGLIVWSLMSVTRNPPVSIDFCPADPTTHEDPAHDQPSRDDLRPAYSGRLVELTYQCLPAFPGDRISVADLDVEIDAACADIGGVLAEMQAAVDAVPPGAIPPHMGRLGANQQKVAWVPVEVRADKYPLGGVVLNDTVKT